MIDISIIGSAGRDKNKEIDFDQSLSFVEKYIINNICSDWNNITLVSGGAAYIDHIAVKLFLKYKCKLLLHLPCQFENKKYHDTGSYSNPGKTANLHHKVFSEKVGYNTLKEIEDAINSGCEIKIHNGFFARNKYVAQSKYIIALTFNDADVPLFKSGTAHTWNCSKSKNKVHFNIDKI